MAARGEGKPYDLQERTARFGEAIIQFAKKVKRGAVTTPLIMQIVRSGTSVGANYCEADNASSKRDFRHRISICQREAKETKYWLRMIAAADDLSQDAGRKLWQEAKELHLIFTAMLRKTKSP